MSKKSEFISEEYIASWKKYDCEAVASLVAKREALDSRNTNSVYLWHERGGSCFSTNKSLAMLRGSFSD